MNSRMPAAMAVAVSSKCPSQGATAAIADQPQRAQGTHHEGRASGRNLFLQVPGGFHPAVMTLPFLSSGSTVSLIR